MMNQIFLVARHLIRDRLSDPAIIVIRMKQYIYIGFAFVLGKIAKFAPDCPTKQVQLTI